MARTIPKYGKTTNGSHEPRSPYARLPEHFILCCLVTCRLSSSLLQQFCSSFINTIHLIVIFDSLYLRGVSDLPLSFPLLSDLQRFINNRQSHHPASLIHQPNRLRVTTLSFPPCRNQCHKSLPSLKPFHRHLSHLSPHLLPLWKYLNHLSPHLPHLRVRLRHRPRILHHHLRLLLAVQVWFSSRTLSRSSLVHHYQSYVASKRLTCFFSCCSTFTSWRSSSRG